MAAENDTSDDNAETASEQHDHSDAGASYALIHRATSLTNYQNLDDPDSIEAQVARGRGKGVVEERIDPGDVDDEGGDSPPEYHVTVEEGRLKIDSGYVVRFVDEDHLDLNPFDIIELDSVKAYPAPASMIENLTPRIQGQLKEFGYAQVRGNYSASDSRFYAVRMGWDAPLDNNPWDRIMEVIEQTDSPLAAVDYVVSEEGPDRWGVDEIAAVRDIEPESVSDNVRMIANDLNE